MKMDNIQDKIIEEFEHFSDKSHRFAYFRKLIQIGNALEPIPAAELDSEHEVNNASKRKIWIKAKLVEGKVYFTADSNNPISKGLVGLLLRVFSGNTPKEIINMDLYFLSEINLYERLNQDWLNDLLAIMQKIKSLSARLQLQEMGKANMPEVA